MKEEFVTLANGKGGKTEICIARNEQETHMSLDDGSFYINFMLRDDEVHLLQTIISFIKEDDKKVCKSSRSTTIGKFATFRVELVKDEERPDQTMILIGRGSIGIMYHTSKSDIIAACESALENV